MKEYRIRIHFPVECEYFEMYESDIEALDAAEEFAINDAKELAGTRGIKTWDNIWNSCLDEILDMSMEDGKNFVDKEYRSYLKTLIYIEATPVEDIV